MTIAATSMSAGSRATLRPLSDAYPSQSAATNTAHSHTCVIAVCTVCTRVSGNLLCGSMNSRNADAKNCSSVSFCAQDCLFR